MTPRERFHACMNYAAVDRVPNHEVGTWVQTKLRWREEGLATDDLHWDWFVGEPHWGFDPREYIDVRFDLVPPFEEKVLAREGATEVIQRANGVVSRALVAGAAEGMRASMDEYLRFPVATVEDFRELKKRYRPATPSRYPPYWEQVLRRSLEPGAFSENLTVRGIDEKTVCIGDVFQVGEALLQVTQPRTPCAKLAGKHDEPQLVKWVADANATGFYMRVLREGTVARGDPFTLVEPHPTRISIWVVDDIIFDRSPDAALMTKLVEMPEFGVSGRTRFRQRLAKLPTQEQ